MNSLFFIQLKTNPNIGLNSLLFFIFSIGITGCKFAGQEVACEDMAFFVQWDKILNQMDNGLDKSYPSGFYPLGYIEFPVPNPTCTFPAHLYLGVGYEGDLFREDAQILIKDSLTRDPILFFDFSMQPGDSILVKHIFKPLNDSEHPLKEFELKFWLILSWKSYDTCLQDTVFMFRHNYETYFDEKVKDEIHFVTRKSGPVGWAVGLNEDYMDYTQFLNSGVGRLYFTEGQLDSTKARADNLELVRSQNMIHCLKK
ncbi:MAG: hypothetical protein R3C61_28460 [Bacteroidia bacterium]